MRPSVDGGHHPEGEWDMERGIALRERVFAHLRVAEPDRRPTISRVAERSNLHRDTVADLFRGKMGNVRTLYAVAQNHGITIADALAISQGRPLSEVQQDALVRMAETLERIETLLIAGLRLQARQGVGERQPGQVDLAQFQKELAGAREWQRASRTGANADPPRTARRPRRNRGG